ncbi:MAG: DUF2336 domain-containing protein [Rhizobiales bacterium]|nr:DUF2336 domain-containing protein [Hyphomicrobiales bacterium]
MIVEQFIQWVVTAPPEKRAKATHALARAYLRHDFSADDMDAAEAAMTFLLDDPDRSVRMALADVLAVSEHAPRHILFALLDDSPDIGALVAARSPVLTDSELVDLAAARERPLQMAIAGRLPVSASLSAAIAEVTPIEVCERLMQNSGAVILSSTLLRLAERFGHDTGMQHLLLKRDNLPVAARQLVVAHLSDQMCECAVREARMDIDRAEEVSREARDRATLTLARGISDAELPDLLAHLRDTQQLTTVLLLRAICAGQVAFFAEALALLSGIARPRVSALLSDNATKALRTLYVKAGLPDEAYPAFQIAFDVYTEEGAVLDVSDQYRFTRIMIERVLERYRGQHLEGVDDLLTMLRRFASETARDAARNFVHLQIKAA